MERELATFGASPIVLPTEPHRSLTDRIFNKIGGWRSKTKKRVESDLYPTVTLSYWRPEAHYDAVNFGDELSRAITELLLARKHATLSDETRQHHQLVAIGSVLHLANDGATIWGTGLHGSMPEKMHRYRTLDVRATRGPITRQFLHQRGIEAPEIYGDPGLLTPLLAGGRFNWSGEFDTAFVPNLHDMRHLQDIRFSERFPQIQIINPLRAWNTVVADILRFNNILSSSLHGLVIAEAYGIPARYVRLTEREALLKYEDYFEGTGRTISYATSVEQALDLGGAPIGQYDPSPLLEAFPYDLWDI